MFDMFKGTVTAKDWAAVAVILCVTVILGVAFYFLVHDRQQQQLAQTQTELAEVRQNLVKAREIESNIGRLRLEAQKMDMLVTLFEERLPDQREIPQLLSRFERLGNELGLRVRLTSERTIRDVNKEELPYRVTVWGDFHTIVTFINMLERDNRYIKISDIDIKEEEPGLTSGMFVLSTFRFLQPTPQPTGVTS